MGMGGSTGGGTGTGTTQRDMLHDAFAVLKKRYQNKHTQLVDGKGAPVGNILQGKTFRVTVADLSDTRATLEYWDSIAYARIEAQPPSSKFIYEIRPDFICPQLVCLMRQHTDLGSVVLERFRFTKENRIERILDKDPAWDKDQIYHFLSMHIKDVDQSRY